jgi:molybdenum cofactor biosynthesis protein B
MTGQVAKDPNEKQAAEAEARRAVRVLTVTISDSRSNADDESGRRLRSLLETAGFTLVPHRIVADEPALVRGIVRELAEQDLADALVTTGGTGIAPRDQTYEALEPLLEKKLDGFGEAFRRLSWDEVGARSVLSRAVAGVAGGRFVVALPGSPKAVTLAVEKLVIPLLVHAVALARGEAGQHRHGGSGT